MQHKLPKPKQQASTITNIIVTYLFFSYGFIT